jgi:membrane protease YdiL (CAAX protease family)
MHFAFVQSLRFWRTAFISAGLLALFFLWELGAFASVITSPPRPAATQGEMLFTATLIVLFALNAGLFAWRRQQGTCPVGTRRASVLAGALGAVALLCPVCLAIPISLLGISLSLLWLAPYIPLLRFVALLILVVSTVILWPHTQRKSPQP